MDNFLSDLRKQERVELKEKMKRRQAEEEILTQEILNQKEDEEEKLRELKALEEEILEKLNKAKKKNFELLIEASSWERVFECKTEELKQIQEELNRDHEKIWKSREDFCSQTTSFISDFFNLLKRFTTNDILPNGEGNMKEIKNDIKNLEISAAKEREMEENLDKKLEILENEKSILLAERNSLEFKRLEESIQIIRESCTELERRIEQKKELIHKKNARFENSAKNTQLFSFVTLDDIKKLSQFRINSNLDSFKLSISQKDKIS